MVKRLMNADKKAKTNKQTNDQWPSLHCWRFSRGNVNEEDSGESRENEWSSREGLGEQKRKTAFLVVRTLAIN